MKGHGAIEVAKTVMEVADIAWTAMEHRQHHHHHNQDHQEPAETDAKTDSDEQLESLRSENRRLRSLLEQNLRLLQDLSESSVSSNDCPSDVRHFYLFLMR